MPRPGGSMRLTFLALFVSSAASINFTQCLVNFMDKNITEGGIDFNGRPVNDPKQAVGLTYLACKEWCGPGQETSDWSVFSQQFSAWLLPWLALVSQLPFGAESKLDNLISVALTVGSPTLAAFSLAITAMNTRWANDRFSAIKYPNRRNTVKALIYLQQVPLRLTTRNGLLASLIVLPENDAWWESLADRLENTHTWTIAAATSIVWVIIAFVLTLIDSFVNLGAPTWSGRGVGSLWLWLIPIVIGWLWIPFSSYDKLRAAISKANDIAFVAAPDRPPQINGSPSTDPPRRAYDISNMQAIRISEKTEVFARDAARTAPVFNYARIWEWWRIVETIARAFEQADANAGNHRPVNRGKEWLLPEDRGITVHRGNRTGTVGQVQNYCGFSVQGEEEPVGSVPSGAWKRIVIASVFALGLQWGTTGSAAMIMIMTPTTGLGCRSGSVIFYGIVSTMIWLMLLLSSYLAHHANVRRGYGIPRPGFNTITAAEGLATSLRRLSIMAAGCNALWIILVCVFELSDFYYTCYCNSSVLGRGVQRAYTHIIVTVHDYGNTKVAWVGGFTLAGGCASLYLFFLNLMLEPSHETSNR